MPEQQPRRIEIRTPQAKPVEIAVIYIGKKVRNSTLPPKGPKGISPN